MAAEPEPTKPIRFPGDGDKSDREPILAAKSENLIEDLYTGLVEQTFYASPYVPASQMRPYNPDDLYQKRNDYGIYEEMLQDDQVSVCAQIKKDLVLASGWDVVTEGEQDGDVEIKEDLESSLREQTEGSFDEMLEEILTAYDFGFSVTEKVFKKRDDGSDKLGLRCLKTRHPATWLLHTDDKGYVEKYEQLVEKSRFTVNPKSVIHYVNHPRFQNPYGTSDLRAAYNAWFTKRQVIKYFAIFLEKSASPVPVARYDKNAPQQARTDIFNALKSFQAKTALVVPQELQVEFLEAKNTGEAYEKAINIFNMFIGRSMFIPDLLGFQGGATEGGSYALGKDQIRLFFKHVNRRREALERIVNMQIIRPLVLYNYGNVEKHPKFKLRPIEDDQAAELAKVWLEAAKGKLYKPNEEEINHFRKIVKFPEGPVEFSEPVQVDPETGLPMPPKPPGMKPGDEDEEQKPPKGKKPAPKPAANPVDEKKKYSQVSRYSAKVNFSAIENTMDTMKDRLLRLAAPIVARVVSGLQDQVGTTSGNVTSNAGKIAKIYPSDADMADLKGLVIGHLREAYGESKRQASQEIDPSNKRYSPPLPAKKFLDFLDGESEMFVNDWADNMSKLARVRVVKAIKDGEPLSRVFDTLDDEITEQAQNSIDRFARTKFTEVMNRGRLEHFESTGVVDAYEYSAILDDRTSPICEGLHGKVFKAGREPIPPLHFNCRSLLVPITKFEDWSADTEAGGKPIQSFIDENKGAGFAKR